MPEAFEVETWGHPTFRVGSSRGKMFAIAGEAIEGEEPNRVSLKADPPEREALLQQGGPFFLPPYVGPRGWLGIDLDHPDLDWEEVAELVAIAYCLVAPKPLANRIAAPPPLVWR